MTPSPRKLPACIWRVKYSDCYKSCQVFSFTSREERDERDEHCLICPVAEAERPRKANRKTP